jgi:hypothetical protein
VFFTGKTSHPDNIPPPGNTSRHTAYIKARANFKNHFGRPRLWVHCYFLSRATTRLRNLVTPPKTTPKKNTPRPWTQNSTLKFTLKQQNTILFYNKVEKYPHPHKKTEVLFHYTTMMLYFCEESILQLLKNLF